MELDLQRLFGLHVYSCTIHTVKIVLGNLLEEALAYFSNSCFWLHLPHSPFAQADQTCCTYRRKTKREMTQALCQLRGMGLETNQTTAKCVRLLLIICNVKAQASHVCTCEISSYISLLPPPPPLPLAKLVMHMYEAPACDMQHVAHGFCHYVCTFYL